MKMVSVLGVSEKWAKKTITAAKDAVSWIKFADYIVKFPQNFLHSDFLALVWIALSSSSAWIALGWMFALYFGLKYWTLRLKVGVKSRRFTKDSEAHIHRKPEPPARRRNSTRLKGKKKGRK